MAIVYFFTHTAMLVCFLSILYASFGAWISNYPEEKIIIANRLLLLKKQLFSKRTLPRKILFEALSKINSLLLILF